MNTTFWGPSGWKFLHILTFIYPEFPTFSDKVKMRDFMYSLPQILPCKYCRISFGKYCKSIPIDEYLVSRGQLIEWLYKMHNKVNKKLRAQGFCHYDNPTLEHVYSLYKPHQKAIIKTLTNNNTTNKLSPEEKIQKVINYICNIGFDFLGSIIFNYQGYYSNCHTSDEKVKIVSVYDKFFNSIIPLICMLSNGICDDGKKCISRYNIPKYKIRQILTSNEAYTKLINWFYKCNSLATPSTFFIEPEKYEEHFRHNIANSCNNPKSNTSIKSCRKTFKSISRNNKSNKKTKKSL
jgi:hypothetical protein